MFGTVLPGVNEPRMVPLAVKDSGWCPSVSGNSEMHLHASGTVPPDVKEPGTVSLVAGSGQHSTTDHHCDHADQS